MKYYKIHRVFVDGVVHGDAYPIEWSDEDVDRWLVGATGWSALCGHRLRWPTTRTQRLVSCLLCLARDEGEVP